MAWFVHTDSAMIRVGDICVCMKSGRVQKGTLMQGCFVVVSLSISLTRAVEASSIGFDQLGGLKKSVVRRLAKLLRTKWIGWLVS